ncbi:ATP-binding cassette sub-family C member 4-like [Lycorma delicatula]|uniref:ATP-binding cassette sub-family C member 4-like n=1 Tax=Lycorma delicatula TaxID=130591 RepID=UPI003F517685
MDESLLKKCAKPPNPRATANPLSAFTFSWVFSLFCTGYKRELEVTDLYRPLKEHNSNYLGNKFERIWNEELTKCQSYSSKKKCNPSLITVIKKAYGVEIALYGIFLVLCEVVLRSTQPLFFGCLIRYFTQKTLEPNATLAEREKQVTIQEAYISAAGVIFCSFVDVIVQHPYLMALLHLGMKIHVGCVSLVYRKVLRLSKTALGETTIGEIVNLLSNDVNRFDYCLLFFNYLWVGPLQTVVITILLYREVGLSSIVGVLTLLSAIPMQIWLGKKNSAFRLKTALKTDKRLRLMNEIITGIQVIKMYAWEKPFAKLVSSARRKEMSVISDTTYVRSILLSFFLFHTKIAILVSILYYILEGNYVTAEKVFVITCYFNILRQSMSLFFPQGISLLAEALVSVKRLQNFMMYDETLNQLPTKEKIHNDNSYDEAVIYYVDGDNCADKVVLSDELCINETGKDRSNISVDYSIIMNNVTAKWSPDLIENTLCNITLSIPSGQLTVIIGMVGSGKSSLFHAILQELPLLNGTLKVNSHYISYASQEAWLFSGSVRQNILFGEPYDKDRYKEVTRVCALRTDFAQLPYGDKTVVSDRGISLSGGQRARINLARAVYRKSDIYLLDDPLSAVDTHVGKHLFEHCILGFLKNKTCILITHQLQYLNNLENIVMLENGSVICNGNYQSLLTTGKYFAKLLTAKKTESAESETEHVVLINKEHSSMQSIASSYDDKLQEEPPEMAEMRAIGNVGFNVYKEYLKASGSWFYVFLIFFHCCLTQLITSVADYWMAYWVNLEETEFSGNSNITFDEQVQFYNDTGNSEYTNNSKNSFIIDKNILFYKNNSSVNNYSINALEFSTHVVNSEYNFYNLFMLDREMCIYIFVLLTVLTVVTILVRSFSMFQMCVRCSITLHDNMFKSITRAKMKFFNSNTSGRILNRFSKDIGLIDEMLPVAIVDCSIIALCLFGIIGIVGFVNHWLLLPTLIIILIFYLMRGFYLRTSRSIKRLEGVTRSPVFSHLSASLLGLSTIRAFKAQSILEKEFDNHVDLHTSAWYIFLSSNHAFGFWLDFLCVIYISLVTFSFLTIDSGITGSNVGLAITQSLSLTGMFQWFMRQTAETENYMTSVERVLEYTNLEEEPPLESPPDKKSPKSWPSGGKIVFSSVFLQYNLNDAPVLKNLSFTVKSGEKVGIVGRTGAGKSSLISALYRLTDLKGEIFIDNVETSTIGLHELRSKISIIPQEPILFSGTMRANLDPFDEFSDDILWNALKEVELKDLVKELPEGLNAKMSEGGSNFSVGQRQLVCLARAIVRNNKILVLDEATANVDPQTDTLIQSTIRRKFSNCTMLTIAHRLHTVMDSDKILVMDDGTVVEYDHPYILLLNRNGYFYKMVEQTGKTTAEMLYKTAADSYKQHSEC